MVSNSHTKLVRSPDYNCKLFKHGDEMNTCKLVEVWCGLTELFRFNKVA